MIESLNCTPEMKATLKINYTSIKKKIIVMEEISSFLDIRYELC